MGNFYVNVTVRGPRQSEVADWLKAGGFEAFVSPTQRGLTTVYEVLCDSQNDEHIRAFAGSLSQALGCPALAVLNHDDDVLWYGLYQAGVLDHEYNSAPDFFDDDVFGLDLDEDLGPEDDGVFIPSGGDAEALCAAFNPTTDEARVAAILSAVDDETGYVCAFERHEALAEALGLPGFTVCCGYRHLERGTFPPGYGEADFVRCAAA